MTNGLLRRIGFLAVLFLGACDQQAALKRFTTPEHDRLARDFLASARVLDTVAMWKTLSPAIQQIPAVMDSLRLAASALPQGTIDTLRQIGAEKFVSNDVDRSLLTYEIHTQKGWGAANVGVIENKGIRNVDTFRAVALPASLETTNSFRRGAARPTSLIVLLLALGCVVLSLVAARRVVRARIPRRWLWALFALVGVVPITLNWTTGKVMFQLGVEIFSAGFGRAGPAAPWLVTVAFPIGAIVALERVRRKQRNDEPPETGSSQLESIGAS